MAQDPATPGRGDPRRILSLTLPALGALVAEPLFLLADSAIVGRLGTPELAALGVAGALLNSAVSVFVFLAYGTTGTAARLVGAGDEVGALAAGRDAAWLAAAIGTAAALVVLPTAPLLVAPFDVSDPVAHEAVVYLRASLPGLPAMLVLLALVGVLRGLERTRATLWIAGLGAVANAALNVVLVHGVGTWAGLGIAGSAIGTAATQLGMATAGVLILRRTARGRIALAPHAAGIRMAGRDGVPLLVRTVALRAVLLATTATAASLGATALAAHQVAANLWTLLALTLDALAIAAQALVGNRLGAGDVAGVHAMVRTMVRWGVGTGVVLGLLMLAAGGGLGPLFTPDEAVQHDLRAALLVAALAQPLAGYVFVLDGVLIGAGDGRYLARASAVQAALFLPAAALLATYGPSGTAGLVSLWVLFAGGWMVLRAVQLGRRARGDAWTVTGARRT
ncbi:MATE family efflux transporter [Spongisporangium articulatum]|uniref:MATE family efflux transporter n=1 Tax=Spongisporangium articulatum TaxID=3362603 RepID=A0ABW8AHY8_9ACTN